MLIRPRDQAVLWAGAILTVVVEYHLYLLCVCGICDMCCARKPGYDVRGEDDQPQAQLGRCSFLHSIPILSTASLEKYPILPNMYCLILPDRAILERRLARFLSAAGLKDKSNK